ncbi:hypothetical protein FEM48_ZijujUnG0124900 [Ziziphus jujuba var. spinosa]|uniref:Uncharacterized protein n=1 Tax=Ziziphus jujuba var. spinosa TaxID=714518 RepID=A0A978U7R9_ZIZJJ|nr:hypothetical protein FEM48_ZijujUnG0124900 [Ziziphus jujuba var. spinosa]
MFKEIGYNKFKLRYLKSHSILQWGVRLLEIDEDALKLAELGNKYGVIDVYVKHEDIDRNKLINSDEDQEDDDNALHDKIEVQGAVNVRNAGNGHAVGSSNEESVGGARIVDDQTPASISRMVTVRERLVGILMSLIV